MSHSARWVALLLALAAGSSILGIGVVRELQQPKCKWSSPGDSLALETAAVPVIQALHTFHERTGALPASLAECGISEQSQFGPWKYSRIGTDFTLGLGDYGSCFWQSSYSSASRSWYHDR